MKRMDNHDINLLIQQNEELKNENEELKKENHSLKETNTKMVKLMNCYEQIKNLLIPIVSECKCKNSVKAQNIKKVNQLLDECKNEIKNVQKEKDKIEVFQEQQIEIKEENLDDNDDDGQQINEEVSTGELNFDVIYEDDFIENINKDSEIKKTSSLRRQRKKRKLPPEEVDIDELFEDDNSNDPDFELSDKSKSKRVTRKKKLRFSLKQDESLNNDDSDRDPDFKSDDNNQPDDIFDDLEVLKKKPKKYKKVKIKKGKPKKIPPSRLPGQYPCPWPGCDQVYKFKGSLNRHKYRHTGENKIKTPSIKYTCHVCGKGFLVKTHYDGHIRSHTNEKYECEWPGCDFKCNYYQSLTRHKLIHAEIKKYKCYWPNCGKCFRNKHEVKAHVLSHTGERPYQCEITGCQRRFQSRQTMRFHLERHHNVKLNNSQSNQENSKDITNQTSK